MLCMGQQIRGTGACLQGLCMRLWRLAFSDYSSKPFKAQLWALAKDSGCLFLAFFPDGLGCAGWRALDGVRRARA